jgi:hypothetical protein
MSWQKDDGNDTMRNSFKVKIYFALYKINFIDEINITKRGFG